MTANAASGTASFRQLARLIGVNEKAVRKARLRGVFSARSVGRDSGGAMVVTDLHLAVAEWEKSGRRLRGTRRVAAPGPAAVAPSEAMPEPHDGGPDAAAIGGDDLLAGDSGGVPGGPPSLVEAQTAAMIERARKFRLENDVREGSLLEVRLVEKEAFEFARVLREALLNIAVRISAEVAAESDQARVFKLIDTAIRDALEATATTLEVAVNE